MRKDPTFELHEYVREVSLELCFSFITVRVTRKETEEWWKTRNSSTLTVMIVMQDCQARFGTSADLFEEEAFYFQWT